MTVLALCACGHVAGGHMPECTNGACACSEFRPVSNEQEKEAAYDRRMDHIRAAVEQATPTPDAEKGARG